MSRLVLPRARYGARRQHWLAARRAAITGSDAGAILGVDRYSSPLSVYVDKVYGRTTDEESEAAYWGNVLEPVVAREFKKRAGLDVRRSPGLEAHDERAWQLATLDYDVLGDAAPALLECKTTNQWKAEDWPEKGEAPLRVQAQVMHQLIVKDYRIGYAAVLIGGQTFRWYRVEYDPALAEEITRREAEFWRRVQEQNPPAPIGHDADADALSELYPGDPDREVSLDHLESDIQLRRWHAAQAKEHSTAADHVDLEIKAAMGDATEGFVGGHLAATWRVSHPRRLNQRRLATERPDVAEEFTEEHQQRTLLIKKLKESNAKQGN